MQTMVMLPFSEQLEQCVSREDGKERIREGRKMLRQAFFVIYLAIERIWGFEFFENCFPSLVQRL